MVNYIMNGCQRRFPLFVLTPLRSRCPVVLCIYSQDYIQYNPVVAIALDCTCMPYIFLFEFYFLDMHGWQSKHVKIIRDN